MDHQYIYNEQGQKKAVIVPISEWEALHKAQKHQKVRLADMIGAAKGGFKSVKEVDDYVNILRDEWDDTNRA